MTIQDFLDKGAVLEVYSDKESYYAQLLEIGAYPDERQVWEHADVLLKTFGASFQDAIERLVLILKPLTDEKRNTVDSILEAVNMLPEAERKSVLERLKEKLK